MRIAWSVLTGLGLVLLLVMLFWLSMRPGDGAAVGEPGDGGAPGGLRPLRLALIPERDIFAQRRRYMVLSEHLGEEIGRPIELVTLSTYAAVLEEFRAGQIDAAFLGSLVAVLAHDRYGADALVKPETAAGVSTYRGVIFVRADSPIQDVEALAGRSIAMVRTTTAGELFPFFVMHEHGQFEPGRTPTIRWVGTHDDVVSEVLAGRVEAGAAKDLRIDAYLREHPEVSIRRLAVSEAVPANALLVSRTTPAQVREAMTGALLKMHEGEAGRAVLEAFGARRFVPCSNEEYEWVYRMVDAVRDHWERFGVDGPAPSHQHEQVGIAPEEGVQ